MNRPRVMPVQIPAVERQSQVVEEGRLDERQGLADRADIRRRSAALVGGEVSRHCSPPGVDLLARVALPTEHVLALSTYRVRPRRF